MKITNLFRFSLLVISLVFSVNVAFAQISDPQVEDVGNGCDIIKFKVNNYEPSLVYTVKLNGEDKSLSADGTYTVQDPIRDIDYTISVLCEDQVNGLFSSEVTKTARLPKAVETPTIKAEDGCDVPVKFTITNYDNSLSYIWTINGRQFIATGADFEYPSPQEGEEYTATVKVEDGCTSAVSTPVSQTYRLIPVKPIVEANDMACDGAVQFTIKNYTSNLKYTWDINGTQYTTNSPSYTISNPQDREIYDATVKVEKNGCISSVSDVAQRQYLKTPEYPVLSAKQDCGDPITFKLENSSTYSAQYTQEWTINGTVIPVSGDTYTYANFEDKRTYSLVVVVANSQNGFTCKTISAPTEIKAKSVPNSPVVKPYKECEAEGKGKWEDLVIKSDQSYQLLWYDSPVAELPTISPSEFEKDKIGDVTYWVAQKDECTSGKSEVTVSVYDIPEIFDEYSVTICEGEYVTLAEGQTPSDEVDYSWSPLDRISGANDKYVVNTDKLYANTEFTLTAYNKKMSVCSVSSKVNVTVLKKPEITLTIDEPRVCQGGEVTVTNTKAKSGEVYSWDAIDINGTHHLHGSQNVTVSNLQDNTKIQLKASIANYPTCFSENYIDVEVVKRPIANAGAPAYVCYGESVQIGTTDELGVTYSWTPVEGLDNPNSSTPMVQSVTRDIEYTLVVTASGVENCASSPSKVKVFKVDKPTIYNVSGDGIYCEGERPNNMQVKLSGSTTGTLYQLIKDDVPVGEWINGKNGVLTWPNTESTIDYIGAGIYTVRAKKEPYQCKSDMNGTATITSVTSPEVTISMDGKVACPGDEVTVRIKIKNGITPYEFVLVTDGDAKTIQTDTQEYVFTVKPKKPIKYEITRIQDAVCRRDYNDPTDPNYPQLDLNVPNLDDFEIHSSNNDKPVCPETSVQLFNNYSGIADFIWSTGETSRSITVSSTADVTYSLNVITAEGCCVDTTYTLQVVERVPIIIEEFEKRDDIGVPFLCSSDDKFTPNVIPSGGRFISEPAGLISNDKTIDPSKIEDTTDFQLTYEYRDVSSGCVQDTTFLFRVSAINKEVSWTLAPAFDPPWSEDVYEICQPDPTSPKQTIKLQGNPPVSGGEWYISKVEDSQTGATVTSNAYLRPETGYETTLYNITAGETYSISFKVYDNLGCPGISDKKIRVNSKPTEVFESNGITVWPNDTLCIKSELAKVWSNNPIGNFILDAKDRSMKISEDLGKGYLEINPSKGTKGKHKIIYNVEHEGCSYSESVDIYIIEPIRITSLNIPTKYCVTDPSEVITITSVSPTTGHIEIVYESGDAYESGKIVLSKTHIDESPAFEPKWGAGKYTIKYYYNDKYCDYVHSEEVEVFPSPEIDFNMKDNYCFGEVIKMVPNYTGGTFTVDASLDSRVLEEGYKFNTKYSGIGDFKVDYVVTTDKGCEGSASKTFKVRGVKDMVVSVRDYFCEPAGQDEIEGFPKPINNSADRVYFTTDVAIGLTDNGNGTGTIDLTNATYNTSYPVTYHYVEAYEENGATYTCESSHTKLFYVLNETSDFSGYDNGETICSDELVRDIVANKSENTVFIPSMSLEAYPDAFTDNGDGTAVLKPTELPEGFYSITMKHEYYVEGMTSPLCVSYKEKSFYISKIEEINDISLYCHPDANKTAVKLNNAEYGIRYDLYVDGGIYDSYTADEVNEEVKFKAIEQNAGSVYVVGVDPKAKSCSLHMSKEFNVVQLNASVKTKDITCYGYGNGQFEATVNGGVTDYKHQLVKVIDEDTQIELQPVSNSFLLSKGDYKYIVTDNIGCYREIPFYIDEPNRLKATLEQTDVKCYGESTAIIKANVPTNSGVAPYKYRWYLQKEGIDMPLEEKDAIEVGAGLYKVVIEDANKCSFDTTTTVIAPEEPLSVTLLSKVDVQVRGEATGEIKIDVKGGTKDENDEYKYEWEGKSIDDTNRNNKNLENLKSGDYKVKVTDAKGCMVELVVFIAQPTKLEVYPKIVEPKCFGYNDGVISLEIGGGTKPYYITWMDENDNVIEPRGDKKELGGLTTGKYKVLVEDADGNIEEKELEVGENPQVEVTTSLLSTLTNDCYGDENGVIILDIEGGTGYYEVEWINLDPAKLENKTKAVGLGAKTYNIKVVDTNDCGVLHIVEVVEPEHELGIKTENITQNICYNGAEGVIEIEMQGGTPDYKFSWDGTGVDPNAKNIASGLIAGEKYTVTVLDAKSCVWTKTYTMENPAELTLTLDAKDITCYNDGDASIEAIVDGEYPFSYEWVDSHANVVASGNYPKVEGLTQDVYTVTVTDKLGCKKHSTVEINEPTEVKARVDVNNISCHNENDGEITVYAEGGTGKFTYALYNVGDTTPITTSNKQANLSEGFYQYKLHDENECSWISEVIAIKNPNPIKIDYTVKDVTINGASDGEIKLEISEGTPGLTGYKIEWLHGPSIIKDPTDPLYNVDKDKLENIKSGSYTVSVIDAKKCFASVDIEVNQPEIISLNIEVKDVLCHGDSTGSIQLQNIQGGTGPGTYTITWQAKESGKTYTGKKIEKLPKDTYVLTIVDAAGASFEKEIKVAEPEELVIKTIPNLSELSVSCYGDKTGKIAVDISGGVLPYKYKWEGLDVEDVDHVENLTAGIYRIELKDNNGCSPKVQYSDTIKGPKSELKVLANIVENKCFGQENAKIELDVTGGAKPYRYSWTGAGLVSSVLENQNQYNLRNGEIYRVIVKDSLGCEVVKTYPLGERYEIEIETEVENVLCHGYETGKLHAIVSGGTGDLIPTWSNKAGTFSVTKLDAKDLPAGDYVLTIQDELGCVVTKEATIAQPDELKAKLTGRFVLCSGVDDGNLYVEIEGGTIPYNYTWYKKNDETNIIGDGSHLKDLGEGIYEVNIVDKNNCTASAEQEIKSSTPISIDNISVVNVAVHGDNSGSIEISISGGTAPLTTSWQGDGVDPDKSTEQNQYNLTADTYEVTVTDGLGCKLTEKIPVTQPENIKVTPTIKDIECFNDRGNIILKVTGGGLPYTYEWTGPNGYYRYGEEYSQISDLEPGMYNVTVTDNAGIKEERKYKIEEKKQLTWKLLDSKTELKCKGDSDGYINIEIDGGTRPYSIVWSGEGLDKKNVEEVRGLSAGVYVAQITDANNCPIHEEFIKEITEPDSDLSLEATLSHNVCAADREGAIEVIVSGGTPDYQYTWSGKDGVVPTAQNQEKLQKGKYNLRVKDANDCAIDTVFYIQANNEMQASISGPSNVCKDEEFEIQIVVNGFDPWTIEYENITKNEIFTIETNDEVNVFTHSLSEDSEFILKSVVDANGCQARREGRVIVDVHELPQMTIKSVQEDCCLGETVLVEMIFGGNGPWTINYTDGTNDYISDTFVDVNGYLEIKPTELGTKQYTIKSVSNKNCTVDIDYSFEVTAYSNPTLDVEVSTFTCAPNPIQVSLHATGEAPWHVVYYMNGIKTEYEMTQEDVILEFDPNISDNKFVFESIRSGKRCLSTLGVEYQSTVGLLPLAATRIDGPNMICRNDTVSFSTNDIAYATKYEWTLPDGFTIVSGLGKNNIEVAVSETAVSGDVIVWGINDCGEGKSTAKYVQVDKPMSTNGTITMPAYVCDDNSEFVLSVSEVENATNYEWVMPIGYNIQAGQGTRTVRVKLDKFALSNTVTVIPQNICTEAKPITATVLIRELPFVQAGKDFNTVCSTEARLSATPNSSAVKSEWKLVRGNAEFEDPSAHNTRVTGLMYGTNVLSWNIYDGYCVAYDTVKVTNQNPGITEPEVTQVTICEDYFTLRAGEPEFGMGRWLLDAGDGEIESPNSSETLITGLSNKRTNVIRWEVYSPQCSNSVNVEVISHDLSSLVDAGEDGMSTTGSYRLSARTINDANVTGTWSVVGGDATFADPHNPNTIVSGLVSGINTLRWTLTGYDCEAYDEVRIRMVDEPIASFNIENTEGCEPLTVLFTNTTIGNAEYKWEFGDGSTSDLRNPEHTFEKAGIYTVKLTAKGDKREDVMTGIVTVLPSPTAALSVAERQLYTPNAEAHFYNETEDAVQYFWDFGDGGTSNKANPVYTYLEDGLYDIKYVVTDANLCSDTLILEDYINVGKESYLVFPTAFTPNVEHSNGGSYSEGERRLDVFYPIGRNVDTYKLEIFSSWGVKVFESNDQYIGWDGYYLGKCAGQGTYFYKAEGRFKDGNAFQYSGNLMLIR